MLHSHACTFPLYEQEAVCNSSRQMHFLTPSNRQNHRVWSDAKCPPRRLHRTIPRCARISSSAASSGHDMLQRCLHGASPDVVTRKVRQMLASLSRSAAGIALAGILLTECAPGVAYARPRLTQDEQLTVDLFKRNTPSVVFITNLAVRYARETRLLLTMTFPPLLEEKNRLSTTLRSNSANWQLDSR
jgi:hypothetical protein